MKIKKNQRNRLKLYLITKNNYTIFSLKKKSQLLDIKLLEIQFKKIIKFFFQSFVQELNSRNFYNFFSFLNQIKKNIVVFEKKKLHSSLLTYFLNNKLTKFNLLYSILKSNFLQIYCYFLKITAKNFFFSHLTNIIFCTNINYFKKINFYFYYNYLIFWDIKNNINFFLILIFYVIYKIKTYKNTMYQNK